MTIGQHLEELRRRLIISMVSVLVGFALAFWRMNDVIWFLRRPLDALPEKFADKVTLTQIQIHGGFVGSLKIAFFAGAIVAAPVLLHQMWAFIGAGLYRQERRAVKFYAIPGFLLFLGGAALAYFYVIPYAFEFLVSFAHENVGLEESILNFVDYASTVSWIMFAFGIVFQLPVVMVFLMRIGIVEPATFKRYRRHAIVANFALAMILTPPDIISQIAMAGCLAFLYECAILIGGRIAKPRET